MRTKLLKVAVCATALKIAQHGNIDMVSIKPKLLHSLIKKICSVFVVVGERAKLRSRNSKLMRNARKFL